MTTAQLQLKLAAAAVFLGAVILVFFTRSAWAWVAEAAVGAWFVLMWARARRASSPAD